MGLTDKLECWFVGDVNFAPELSDLRYRHHLRVILIHHHNVADALLSCAHEHYNFPELFADVTDCRVDLVRFALMHFPSTLWWLRMWSWCVTVYWFITCRNGFELLEICAVCYYSNIQFCRIFGGLASV